MDFHLLAQMERDGFRASRKSTSRSGQYNGPCIFGCEGLGEDRLRVQPNWRDKGWFICEHCGAKGTSVDYLMIKRGMSQNEALKTVGWKAPDGSTPKFSIPASAYDINPKHEAPSEKWGRVLEALQSTVRAFSGVSKGKRHSSTYTGVD